MISILELLFKNLVLYLTLEVTGWLLWGKNALNAQTKQLMTHLNQQVMLKTLKEVIWSTKFMDRQMSMP